MLSVSFDFWAESVQQILDSVLVNDPLKFKLLLLGGILAPLLCSLTIIWYWFEFSIDLLEGRQDPARMHYLLAH